MNNLKNDSELIFKPGATVRFKSAESLQETNKKIVEAESAYEVEK